MSTWKCSSVCLCYVSIGAFVGGKYPAAAGTVFTVEGNTGMYTFSFMHSILYSDAV